MIRIIFVSDSLLNFVFARARGVVGTPKGRELVFLLLNWLNLYIH
jgi:hypothetical protein